MGDLIFSLHYIEICFTLQITLRNQILYFIKYFTFLISRM